MGAALALQRGGHAGQPVTLSRHPRMHFPVTAHVVALAPPRGMKASWEQREELQGWNKRELSLGQHRPCQQDISSQRLRAEPRTFLELEGEQWLRANPPAL